jgi:hypothetical protein
MGKGMLQSGGTLSAASRSPMSTSKSRGHLDRARRARIPADLRVIMSASSARDTISSAIRSEVISPATTRAARATDCRSASLRSRHHLMPSTRLAASPARATLPLSPTRILAPHVSETTTGRPAANASCTTRPQPSQRDGSTSPSDVQNRFSRASPEAWGITSARPPLRAACS